MRILGIDPGLGITGYGVVSATDLGGESLRLIEAGVIKTQLKEKIPQRLFSIHKEIQSLIDELRPDIGVLEDLYSHYKHPRTSILMAHARGAILLACAQRGLPVIAYSAKRIKLAVLGNGNASKEQVQRMVQNILDLKKIPESNDVSDALALAIAHAYMNRKR